MTARGATGDNAQRKNTMKDFETIPTGGRFRLGKVVATPGAIEALAQANIDGRELLSKHHRGDWGDLSEDDKRENEFSVDKYLRIWFCVFGRGYTLAAIAARKRR